jgi:spore germination cell wall hydrolase CwlJ-like protein
MIPLLADLPPHSYTCLAEVVQVEARRFTDDEYGVAASVLNRVASPDFPNTVCSVVYSKGQYEGVSQNYTLRADPDLVEKLKSPEGQMKIVDALKVLDGRTDFKGQSMLHNRIVDEDPMFHPEGNFYHYNWQ